MPRIADLIGVEVEHLISAHSGEPLVKIRALTAEGGRPVPVALGQVPPAAARQIAEHLAQAAARAEYEHDLVSAALDAGLPDRQVAVVLGWVRSGEERRLA